MIRYEGDNIWVTPKVKMSRLRFAEWLAGVRPAPGQDAKAFFNNCAGSLYSHEAAAELLQRHLRLERLENEQDEGKGISPEIREELIRRGWTPPKEAE